MGLPWRVPVAGGCRAVWRRPPVRCWRSGAVSSARSEAAGSALAAHISQQRRCAATPGGTGATGPARAESALLPRLYDRWVRWSYKYLGGYVYPPRADICNCGVNYSSEVPRPELVYREGMKQGSKEWKMQLYGAALYWYMATMPGAKAIHADPHMLRGKDVLEVACMRGGGARYLMEVAGPRRYVATDFLEDHVELARSLRPETPEGLEFMHADAADLADAFPPETFDFVLCVQAAASFTDLPRFVHGARHVLRPGGRLLVCDAFRRGGAEPLLQELERAGMEVVTSDIGRAVHAVGLCQLRKGQAYMHIVARRPELPPE